jgi:hypothetical protein
LSALVAAAVLGYGVPAIAGTKTPAVASNVYAAQAAAAVRAPFAAATSVSDPGQRDQVSCGSVTSCLAVGGAVNNAGFAPFAASFHAGTWKPVSVTKAPGYAAGTSTLTSVSCKAATYCLAVGQYISSTNLNATPYAMTWNGTTLTPVVKLPFSSKDWLQEVDAVSCTAVRSCVVFGSGFQETGTTSSATVMFAWTWNGSKWSLAVTPVSGGGTDVVIAARCFSTAFCVLAGANVPMSDSSTFTPLLATWNGKALTDMHPLVPPGLTQAEFASVSCVAPASCAATGLYAVGKRYSAFLDVTTATGWKLTKWSGPSGATSSVLAGVSCASKTSCVTAGGFDTARTSAPAALTWNGTKWTVTKVPYPGKASIFFGLSCPALGNCTAIGTIGAAPGSPFDGHWNGQNWKLTAA